MKKNRIVYTIIGVFVAAISLAQNEEDASVFFITDPNNRVVDDRYADSLIFKTESGMELVFGFKQMSLKQAYISNDLWDSMLNVMETSVNNSEIVGGKKVVYQILSSDTDKFIVSVSITFSIESHKSFEI
jgi:hypothetical protein